MRFLLYNIRYGAGCGRAFHLPLPFSGYLRYTTDNLVRITAFIKSMQPDFVGLIEVDGGTYRSGNGNQAAVIAEALGHSYVYRSKYGRRSLAAGLPLLRKQGNAFLAGREIKDRQFHYFRKGVKRLIMKLDLEDMVVFLVHLSISYRHRQHQLRDLYSMVRSAGRPAIVAGDFNVFGGDPELQLFLAATGLVNANRQGLPSHPSRFPRMQLDFILHSPDIRVTDFAMPPVAFSDHMPLVCDFEL